MDYAEMIRQRDELNQKLADHSTISTAFHRAVVFPPFASGSRIAWGKPGVGATCSRKYLTFMHNMEATSSASHNLLSG